MASRATCTVHLQQGFGFFFGIYGYTWQQSSPARASACCVCATAVESGAVQHTLRHRTYRIRSTKPTGVVLSVLLKSVAHILVSHATSRTQGMNYLAGFVLVTLADCVLSEREGTPDPSSRDPGSAGRFSTTASGDSSSSRPDDSLPHKQPKGSLEQAGAVAVSDAGKGGGGDATGAGPTASEINVIEGECVQVMQGIIALQGGVLSRDLWGLHAVSGDKAEGVCTYQMFASVSFDSESAGPAWSFLETVDLVRQ